MQKPWIMACLALIATPAGTEAVAATDQPWLEGDDVFAHRVQRERRGFGMEIDHERRRIVVRAYFYAARNSPAERRQLAAILKFWRRQNDRFVYRLGKGKTAVDYQIVFSIRQAPGVYGEGNFFFPSPQIDPRLINQVEVVSSEAMKRLNRGKKPGQRIVGYAPNNFVYIADDMARHTWIGVHEAGHRLGLSHEAQGLMNPGLDHISRRLSRQAVRQILACGNIIGRGRRSRHLVNYPVQAAQVKSIGEVPQGFYTGGKVKRR